MNEKVYYSEQVKLIYEISDDQLINESETLTRSMNFVSANLSNFLPETDCHRHEEIFREVLFNQQLSWLDMQYTDVFRNINYEGPHIETIELLKKQPSIICTFHHGSIRLINYLLGKNSIEFSLVVSGAALKEHGNLYRQMYDQHSELYDSQYDFKIISAQSTNSGIQMIRELKKGRSLLIYIDGNTGAESKSAKNENLIKINFLSESIYARKGAAFLSYVAKVPVVPIVNYRKSLNEIMFRFFDPIFPHEAKNKENYIFTTTQKIYDLFAEIVYLHPGQWEAWLYLQTQVNPNDFKVLTPGENCPLEKNGLRFNFKQFGLFKIETDFYLFNKRTYEAFKINKQLFISLETTIKGIIDHVDYEKTVFDQLIANKVFI
jgi:lauroyl/myristoyl acyltransferase